MSFLLWVPVMKELQFCFSQLRNVSRNKKDFTSLWDLEMISHLYNTSHVNYYNWMYFFLSQSSHLCLQIVLKTTVRILTGTKQRDLMTPILASLCWLPVKGFQGVLLITFNVQWGSSPELHSWPFRCLWAWVHSQIFRQGTPYCSQH